MEDYKSEYSVETKNRFQLALDDDVDVYDILRQEEAKPAKKKNEPEVTKNVKKNTAKSEKTDKLKKVGQKIENSNDSNIKNLNNKSTARGNENRPPRMRPGNQDSQKSVEFETSPASQEQQSGGFGGRGMRRGGSAGFRGRGGRGGGGGGVRRYDRHSGSERTGIKAVEKKEGFGSHNWGGEIDAQLESGAPEVNRPDSGERTAGDGEEAPIATEESAAAGADGETEAEPEVKEMTLDEWRAAQAGSRTKQQFNVRRAGEGEDPKQWKKTVTLEPRKRAESTESYEEEEVHEKVDDTRNALNKLNIQIKFSTDDTPRGGPSGGRGGRGRGGGRGGGFGGPRSDRPPRSGGFGSAKRGSRGGFNDRGGFRNNRQENSAPIVDNELEFPSLGSK